jgi:hypothetical protein
VTIVALFLALFSGAASVPMSVSSTTRADLMGNCLDSNGQPIGLRKLLFLENRSLVIEQNGVFRIDLVGESIEILRTAPQADKGAYVTNLGYEVSPDDDIDIESKFALLAGDLVVYWKETYQHRIYRQGLFRIESQGVRAVCQGKAGFNSAQ